MQQDRVQKAAAGRWPVLPNKTQANKMLPTAGAPIGTG